jgi:hypothetical protein
VTEIKLDSDKNYRLTKVHPDGTYEVKVTGFLQHPDATVRVDQRCLVGRGISNYWSTSWVTEIEKIHNGIKFHTENSVYLLEEYGPNSSR